jgi:hypothetical protein
MPNPIERFANVAKEPIKLFADDTSLYMIVDDPVDAAETLNTDLTKIHDWSMKCLVKFNPDKTESMIVSRKSNRTLHPPLPYSNKGRINVE